MDKHIYLDNAASTYMDKEVLEAMLPYFTEFQGNPSSTHYHGRNLKNALEKARKTVAECVNARPSEIFFTSGGSEADNMAIFGAVEAYQIKHIISSPLEHHAITHPIEHLDKKGIVKAHWLSNDAQGNIDLAELETLLKTHQPALVVLMHGNNEIGNLLDLAHVSALCQEHKALFHSDTVQTVGHYPIDARALSLSFFTGAAHKFHGPKGVGFLYVNEKNHIPCLIHGGSQERNLRGGTENLTGIIGLAKALEIGVQNQAENYKYISHLKQFFTDKLKQSIPNIQVNGNPSQSMASVLNVSFPMSEYDEMLLFQLDLNKISVSAGSACTSGSNVGSHVLRGLGLSPEAIRNAIRFSFGRQNTISELEVVLALLDKMFNPAKNGA